MKKQNIAKATKSDAEYQLIDESDFDITSDPELSKLLLNSMREPQDPLTESIQSIWWLIQATFKAIRWVIRLIFRVLFGWKKKK